MISVALFDLDDTLFAHRHAVAVGVLAHRTSHGLLGDDLAELARWNELEEHHYHRYLSGELDFLEQRRERSRGFVEPHGVTLTDTEADEWFERYLAEYTRAWRLHDDALPCLDALERRGIHTGIITNGDLGFQSAKLTGVGLTGRFEHVIASGTLGFAKPDPRIFGHAAHLFGVPPGQALYVGDRLHTDAIGAAEAGLTGVWLARDGASDEERGAARAAGAQIIHSLDELPALVR